jgi:hypothetical protein
MTTTTNPEVMRVLARLERRMDQRVDHVNSRINRLYDAGLGVVGAGIVGGLFGVAMTLALTA